MSVLLLWPQCVNYDQGPVLLTLIPAWINNYIHYKVRDEMNLSIAKTATVRPLKFRSR